MLEPYILHKWACYDLPLICMCWLFMPTVIIAFLFSHVTSISITATAASLIQVSPEWPGLPIGVKFDPSDVELLEHLAAKCGVGNSKPHMFIDEFIPTIEGDQGICYTHPENLPGEGAFNLIFVFWFCCKMLFLFY